MSPEKTDDDTTVKVDNPEEADLVSRVAKLEKQVKSIDRQLGVLIQIMAVHGLQ